jgi:hypothetical protein
MKKRLVLASALLLGGVSLGHAASGTNEQQDACRPDVRRFCHQIPADAGDNIFLSCLQDHRAKLSAKCRQVLESNGV